jgi:hypothetical protein
MNASERHGDFPFRNVLADGRELTGTEVWVKGSGCVMLKDCRIDGSAVSDNDASELVLAQGLWPT